MAKLSRGEKKRQAPVFVFCFKTFAGNCVLNATNKNIEYPFHRYFKGLVSVILLFGLLHFMLHIPRTLNMSAFSLTPRCFMLEEFYQVES